MIIKSFLEIFFIDINWYKQKIRFTKADFEAGNTGFEPAEGGKSFNGLANRRFQPLSQFPKEAEDEGLEPPRAQTRRFSRPLPYQLGLILRNMS